MDVLKVNIDIQNRFMKQILIFTRGDNSRRDRALYEYSHYSLANYRTVSRSLVQLEKLL